MYRFIKCLAIPLIAAAITPIAAFAQGANGQIDHPLGTPAQSTAVVRTLPITAATRHIAVEQGETVMLDFSGKTLAWHFDTLTTNSFDLAAIAPGMVPAGQVRVHVADNPTYRN